MFSAKDFLYLGLGSFQIGQLNVKKKELDDRKNSLFAQLKETIAKGDVNVVPQNEGLFKHFIEEQSPVIFESIKNKNESR